MSNVDIMSEIDDLAQALDDIDAEVTVATVIEAEGASEQDFMSRLDMDAILGGAMLLKGDQFARTYVGTKEVYRSGEVILAERAARERNRDKLRKRIKRQQAKRAKLDKARDAKPIDNVRMSACLQMLGNLDRVIADLTMQRYNRFRRVLGDVLVEDIAQDAVIAIAEAMSRTDTSLAAYAACVLWLKSAPQPFVAADGPEGSGRLLGTIIRVIGSSIVATYRKSTIKTWTRTVGEDGKDVWVQRDTTNESLDKLATVAHNTRSDVDTLLTKCKAGGKPKQKSTPPGMRDKRLFARAVIDTAIEHRDLGWLATMLLDDARRRVDGSFAWTENADTIWAGFDFRPMSPDASASLRADFAQSAVRLAFADFPAIVRCTYELIEDPEAMWDIMGFGGNDAHAVAAKILTLVESHEHRWPIDGGTSIEVTMRMIEDPEYRKLALACIVGAETDDDDES